MSGYVCAICHDEAVILCFERDEDGEYQDAVPSGWLCLTHAQEMGYCLNCGQAEESAKTKPSGLCDECQIDAIREENYGDDDGGDIAMPGGGSFNSI